MKKYLLLIIVLVFSHVAYAEDPPDLELSLGIVLSRFENPLINSETENFVLPSANFTYYAESFFIDEEIGYTLKNFENAVINVVGSLNLDFIYFIQHNSQLDDLRDRNPSLMTGMEALIFPPWGEIQFQALQNVFNSHKGQQITLNYRSSVRIKKWNIVPQVGLHWKSKKLLQYYYGIKNEDGANFPLYNADSGVNAFATLDAEFPIDYHWVAGGFVHYTKLASAIEKSPIVEKDGALTMALGVKYVF